MVFYLVCHLDDVGHPWDLVALMPCHAYHTIIVLTLTIAKLLRRYLHLSVTVNPVPSRGYLSKIPPLPHEGAWVSQFPAISRSPGAFGNHGTELTCSVRHAQRSKHVRVTSPSGRRDSGNLRRRELIVSHVELVVSEGERAHPGCPSFYTQYIYHFICINE